MFGSSASLSCDEARRLLKEEGGQLIDVRSPMEFARGALPNAVNIPLQALQGQLNQLDKDKHLLLYCVSGSRSGSAQRFLASMGYDKVYNLGSYQNYFSCGLDS